MKGSPGGYDHNVILAGGTGKQLAARVVAPASGRQMEIWTTEPAVQFYAGNFLDGTITGKRGVVYGQHAAFCLETQHYPDSVNHANFPSHDPAAGFRISQRNGIQILDQVVLDAGDRA